MEENCKTCRYDEGTEPCEGCYSFQGFPNWKDKKRPLIESLDQWEISNFVYYKMKDSISIIIKKKGKDEFKEIGFSANDLNKFHEKIK